MEEKRLSITQIAELLDVHFNTIRQWEKQFKIIVPRSKDKQRSRYYTDNEINLFTKIRDLRDENVSIENIQRLLSRDIDLMEQEQTAIEAMPFSEISITDIKDLISNVIVQREEELKKEFEKKLDEKLAEGFEKQEIKIREQIAAENQRLIDYIESKREEKKSVWSRIFGK